MPNQMSRDELDLLLREIAGGGTPVGTEAMDAREAAERQVTNSILHQLGGILLFGDSVHQFYSDTIQEFSHQLSAVTSQVDQFSLHWHIVSLSRFYASFDLLRRGYFFESATLTRSVWEVALTLAGLKRNIVQLEELFGGRTQGSADRPAPRRVIEKVKEADKKIQKHLLWQNPAINDHDRDVLNVFFNLLNQSNHKSNLGLALNVFRQGEGRSIPTIPVFAAEHTALSWNLLFQAMWSLMMTLSYLHSLHPPAESPWHNRYSKLLRICEYTSEHSPNDVVKGFAVIVEKVFRIPPV